MKVKPSSLLLAGFAVVLALSAAFVARGMLSPHVQTQAAEARGAEANEVKPQPVYAAAAACAVNPGEFLAPASLRWVEVEPANAPAGALIARRAADRKAALELAGATVRRSFKAGDVIELDQVIRPGDPGFVAAVLTPGKRAVSIPTSAVSSNSGLVSAGDWVDVILTLKRETAESMADQDDKTAGMTKLAAQTILTNIRVLALNNDADGIAPAAPEKTQAKTDGKKTAAAPARRTEYRTLTLEVDPQEAEKLAVAKEAGDLQVALRGLREPHQAAAPETSKSTQTARVTHLQDATGVLGTQRPASKTVITYQGSTVVPVTF